jgi:uncharacterized protein YecE (DUF72 family)
MPRTTRKIHIGTSGWVYKHWDKIFYPEKTKNKLEFYSQFFDTVEINATFYRLPEKKTFEKWRLETPKSFGFSVKLSRYITHQKRIIPDEVTLRAMDNFISNVSGLGNKLKIILTQFPPSFKADPERLDQFLKLFRKKLKKMKTKIAVEFRNESWLNEKIFKILQRYGCALVISLSPRIPLATQFTSDLTYIRFHGPGQLFASRYSKKELDDWVKKINEFPKNIKKVYMYFNNDFNGYAIKNARYLKKIDLII